MGDGTGQWTHEELDRWFGEEMGGVDGLEARFPRRARDPGEDRVRTGPDREPRPELFNEPEGTDLGNPDLEVFLTAWNALWDDRFLNRSTADSPFTHLPEAGEGWDGLALETKAALRRGWERYQADRLAQRGEPGHESIVPELSDFVIGGSAPAGADTGPQTEPDASPGGGSGPSTHALMLGGIGILAVLVVLLALVLAGGGGGDEGDSSAIEPAAEEDGIDFSFAGGSGTYFGPTSLPPGGTIDFVVVFVDEAGRPLGGTEILYTIGEPPDARYAEHGSTITDDAGEASVEDAPVPAEGSPALRIAVDGDVSKVVGD